MGSLKDLAKLRGLSESGLVARSSEQQNQQRKANEQQQRDSEREAAAAQRISEAPAYPWARPGNLAEVRGLLSPLQTMFNIVGNSEVESLLDADAFIDPPQIVDGELNIDSLLMPTEGTGVYIRGNLTVTHRIVQRFRAGTLVVLGSLRAKHIITSGQILVTEDLHVSGTVYGNCTNHATSVLGTSTIGTLISAKSHMFALLGAVKIGELLAVDEPAPNFKIYSRCNPMSTRRINPDLADQDDPASVAAALASNDAILG
jgi:cytoskeletal protein CcmA (bactofilin family)